jgi:hypothetical protein
VYNDAKRKNVTEKINMRKISILMVIVFMIITLSGCNAIGVFIPNTENSLVGSEEETPGDKGTAENLDESEIHTEEMTGETKESIVGESLATPDSELSTQAPLPIEEVINYFCEVVLQTEYSDGVGDATLVQKWTDRICYRIYGEATEQDKCVLTGFFQQLNEIEGFPGIVPAGENDLTDLALYFYDYNKFNQSFGEFLNYEVADGAVQYWYYTDTNVIYDARIGYRTDIDQYTRNSVLQEEIFNGLGITDSALRHDSIAYQGFSQPQELSEVDWLIIKLLYHPKMKPGMNREECVNVIREIYPLE